MKHQRPTWDEYLGQICLAVSTRGACLRRQHGALLVKDNRILTTGYNGPPVGELHCDHSCMRQSLGIEPGTRYELCRSIHAEMNAILQAAIYGISIQHATLYVTDVPCKLCARLLIQCRISEIVLVNKSYNTDQFNETIEDLRNHMIVRVLNVDKGNGSVSVSGLLP